MNNFHVIVKQTTKFIGRKADEVLEWDFKLCASLNTQETSHYTSE